MFEEPTLEYVDSNDIPNVELLPVLKKKQEMLARICKHFFTIGLDRGMSKNAPLRGFLLQGAPGTGKTELVKQVYRQVNGWLGESVLFAIIDGSDIAAARWGDAEEKMKRIFSAADGNDPPKKKILLFDDIDCFMMGRSAVIAQEWHFSMNAIFFHQLDRINPSETFVFATTNRPDLVDDALHSRLYALHVDPMNVNELMTVVDQMLDATGVRKGELRTEVRTTIQKELQGLEKGKGGRESGPTVRDARQITIFSCIERGLWSK